MSNFFGTAYGFGVTVLFSFGAVAGINWYSRCSLLAILSIALSYSVVLSSFMDMSRSQPDLVHVCRVKNEHLAREMLSASIDETMTAEGED